MSQGNTNWVENFDGTLREPKILPATVPNVLLNGGMGIAVGMTTDIPPHNLVELGEALCALIDNPNLGVEQLSQFVTGPDFATEAPIVTSAEDIVNIYTTGKGSVRQQAKWSLEDNRIIIKALPMHSSGSKVMDQIGMQMANKKLPMVVDLIDESDIETRLVIELRSKKIDVDQLMAHLFASTDLDRNHRVNLNVIGIDGKPAVKSLPSLLTEWLQWRTALVKRRTEYRLDQIAQRIHLLDGLLIAFLNIDEIIAIIRTEAHPKQVLMSRFQLSELQANYILDTRLRQLARIEEVEIQKEHDKLAVEQSGLQQLLGSSSKLKKQLKLEIKSAMEQFGDPRRSPIQEPKIVAAHYERRGYYCQ